MGLAFNWDGQSFYDISIDWPFAQSGDDIHCRQSTPMPDTHPSPRERRATVPLPNITMPCLQTRKQGHTKDSIDGRWQQFIGLTRLQHFFKKRSVCYSVMFVHRVEHQKRERRYKALIYAITHMGFLRYQDSVPCLIWHECCCWFVFILDNVKSICVFYFMIPTQPLMSRIW